MNDLFAPLYEWWFNWDVYQVLLTCLYDNNDYGKFGWLLLIVPLLLLVLFYKVWEPMRRPRLMWSITIIIISLIGYMTTTGIVFNNVCLLDELNGQDSKLAETFIVQISLISALYFLLVSLIYTFIVKRFSTHNSHNPF
jgi:drug/metabolite transporter (DMT)-like permease|tara:strand:+ start:430 stop:846 length:417 start_codon:yes stop_codon:yes gene_type:complete